MKAFLRDPGSHGQKSQRSVQRLHSQLFISVTVHKALNLCQHFYYKPSISGIFNLTIKRARSARKHNPQTHRVLNSQFLLIHTLVLKKAMEVAAAFQCVWGLWGAACPTTKHDTESRWVCPKVAGGPSKHQDCTHTRA